MNYSDFSNPASLYKINPDALSYSSIKNSDEASTTKPQLVLDIIAFCRSVPLWQTLNGPGWKKQGLVDLKIDKNIIKAGLMNGNSCTIKFSHLPEYSRAEVPDPDDKFTPEFILLNGHNKYQQYTIPTWSQVLFMELGNYKNYGNFNTIYKNKSLGLEEFVRKWEKLEYDIRTQIVDAYSKGQFDSDKYVKQDCIFRENVSFESYMNADENKGHREMVRQKWWNRKI